MSRPIVISRFGRTVSSLDGKGQPHQPMRMVNFTTTGAKLKFRYGYATAKGSPVEPGTDFACLGLGYVQNPDGSASELLGVETWGDTTRPFLYSLGTPHFFIASSGRTSLGPDGTTVAGGEWIITSYAENAYFINPGGDKTVYRHKIGTGTDFTALEDVAYDPIESPELTIDLGIGETARRWDATDTFSYPVWDHTWLNDGAPYSITQTVNTDGSVTLHGWDDDDGPTGGELQIKSEFASDSDLSGADYLYFVIDDQGATRGWFDSNTKPKLKLGGTWTEISSFEYFKQGSDAGEFAHPTGQVLQAVYILNVEGIDLSAVGGIQFSMFVDPRRYGYDIDLLKISPLMFGGTYLNSTVSTQRLWDESLENKTITYGARFANADSSETSDVFQRTIDAPSALGFRPGNYSCAAGARVRLTCTPPDSPFTKVEFLRLDTHADPPEWKLLETVTDPNWTHIDTLKEYELWAMTGVEDGVAPDQPPVFRTAGIVNAFPFKQFMVWLTQDGSENVQMSSVGDAEILYIKQQEYEADDLTQPGVRTLADNADDQPVWGTQAGDVAVIVGNKAAYVMSGDFPAQMSPTRQIAGSRGIIGPFAGTRFRSVGGQYAAAYCDPDFNIWVVQSVPQFEGDGRGQPIELSLPVRGLIRTFLYDEQRLVNPDLNGRKMQLEFDEESSTLWVILGNRAAVYRQDMNEVGWEFYSYSLRSDGELTTEVWTPDFGNGAMASSIPPGDAAFSNFGLAFVNDQAYCQSASLPMEAGQKTETLRVDGFMPPVLLPATADILGLKYKIDRSKVGDFSITESKVQLRKSGSDWGGNIATNAILTESDNEIEFLVETDLPTVEELNNGDLGIDLQYTQEDVNEAWNDPDNWDISASMAVAIVSGATSASISRTITATYLGPGSPPSFVRVSAHSHPTAGPGEAIGADGYLGRATVDNGIGLVATTELYSPSPIQGTADSTSIIKIPLTGGTGTYPLTATGSVNWTGTSHGISFVFYLEVALSPFIPTSVRVDSVNLSVHYSVTSEISLPWVGWDQSCFTHNGMRVAVRNSGEVDLIEKDFRNDAFIVGPSRDGGFLPPNAEWISQDFAFNGVTARFHGVQTNTSRTDDMPSVFSQITGGDWVGGFQTGYASTRWFRFPLSQRGIQHSFKLTMPETTGGIDSMTLEFDQTSTSKVR